MIAVQTARRYAVHPDERAGLHLTDLTFAESETQTWTESSNKFPPSRETLQQGRVREIYDAHAASLYRYLRSLGLAPTEAEDAVQEIFLRLANHFLQSIDADANLRAWLFQVAHNLSMDVHRSNRRIQAKIEPASEMLVELVDPQPDPERTYLEKEHTMRLNEAVERLTPKQRDGVLLRAQGLRYVDIATALAVSESRAIALVKRGLARIAGGL